MKPVNILTFKWGTLYPAEYVNRLYRGINNIIRDPDGNDLLAPLLQTSYYWYWYQTEGTYSFRHTCTGLK